jgi:hypothetical protein
MSFNKHQIKKITNYINHFRSHHNSQNLIYNHFISILSQITVTNLCIDNIESNNPLYGCNIIKFNSLHDNICPINYIQNAIDIWYSEIQFYDFNNPSINDKNKNFTQLIWKNTSSYGIGFIHYKDSIYICIHFDPCGNYFNQIQNNVLKKN